MGCAREEKREECLRVPNSKTPSFRSLSSLSLFLLPPAAVICNVAYVTRCSGFDLRHRAVYKKRVRVYRSMVPTRRIAPAVTFLCLMCGLRCPPVFPFLFAVPSFRGCLQETTKKLNHPLKHAHNSLSPLFGLLILIVSLCMCAHVLLWLFISVSLFFFGMSYFE